MAFASFLLDLMIDNEMNAAVTIDDNAAGHMEEAGSPFSSEAPYPLITVRDHGPRRFIAEAPCPLLNLSDHGPCRWRSSPEAERKAGIANSMPVSPRKPHRRLSTDRIESSPPRVPQRKPSMSNKAQTLQVCHHDPRSVCVGTSFGSHLPLFPDDLDASVVGCESKA